ncbi:MAG: hypothetical protein RL077_2143 [Verrucomicrobiota bacterium]|jgi:hypothetical protein
MHGAGWCLGDHDRSVADGGTRHRGRREGARGNTLNTQYSRPNPSGWGVVALVRGRGVEWAARWCAEKKFHRLFKR